MNAGFPSSVVPHADESHVPTFESIGFDVAFQVGMRWHALDGAITARVRDHVGGTRGLHLCIVGWTSEFQAHWINLSEAERLDYAFELELFVTATLETLIDAATGNGIGASITQH
jgi:hypothetical protein